MRPFCWLGPTHLTTPVCTGARQLHAMGQPMSCSAGSIPQHKFSGLTRATERQGTSAPGLEREKKLRMVMGMSYFMAGIVVRGCSTLAPKYESSHASW